MNNPGQSSGKVEVERLFHKWTFRKGEQADLLMDLQ